MKYIEMFVDLITRFPMQLLEAELLFCLLHKKRRYFAISFPLSVLIIFLIPYVFPYYTTSLSVGTWFTFTFFLIFVLVQVLMIINFSLGFNSVLFYGAAAYTMQHLLYNINIVWVYCIPLSSLNQNLLKIVVCIILYATCYYFFIRKLRKQNSVRIENKILIIFAVFVLLVITLFSNYVARNYLFSLPTSIYTILSCILIFVIQFGIFEQTKLEQEKNIVEQLLYNNTKQRKISKDTIDLINIKFHDLKYEIARLSNKDSLKIEDREALKDLDLSINLYDRSVKTGNETLDIVITEKNLLCDKFSIAFSCITDAENILFMSRTDIYTLFGNILDNAIESVSETSPDNRFISLNIHKKGNMLSIHSDNYCDKEITFIDGIPQTSKKNRKYHGYGIKSINFIVEKYNGTITMSHENNLFRTDILIHI